MLSFWDAKLGTSREPLSKIVGAGLGSLQQVALLDHTETAACPMSGHNSSLKNWLYALEDRSWSRCQFHWMLIVVDEG